MSKDYESCYKDDSEQYQLDEILLLNQARFAKEDLLLKKNIQEPTYCKVLQMCCCGLYLTIIGVYMYYDYQRN